MVVFTFGMVVIRKVEERSVELTRRKLSLVMARKALLVKQLLLDKRDSTPH